jgi:hypothetical protein
MIDVLEIENDGMNRGLFLVVVEERCQMVPKAASTLISEICRMTFARTIYDESMFDTP